MSCPSIYQYLKVIFAKFGENYIVNIYWVYKVESLAAYSCLKPMIIRFRAEDKVTCFNEAQDHR